MLTQEMKDTIAVMDNAGHPAVILIARTIEGLDAANKAAELLKYIADNQSVLDLYGPRSMAWEAFHGRPKPAPVVMIPHGEVAA